jgi:hypothetical protein
MEGEQDEYASEIFGQRRKLCRLRSLSELYPFMSRGCCYQLTIRGECNGSVITLVLPDHLS